MLNQTDYLFQIEIGKASCLIKLSRDVIYFDAKQVILLVLSVLPIIAQVTQPMC